ncbi:Putative acyl-CoA N-acyltransferase [Septoria linicola]|uniref:Acyl-CoA N-acyltransferase n=1 Tax=Septoria linicola TaxID=215465 RepID=A0A9Q9AR87_9PEZI|nr:putative acyl-CoA N-acyltransferase [Septoria linicola]USW49331.1 Putative acyl-CoA N-acyltransferase [Septoria linicola]
MAIAPHLRRKAAEQAASVAPPPTANPLPSRKPSINLPTVSSPALPPSPPISDDLNAKLLSVGVKLGGPQCELDPTTLTIKSESHVSSQPNPASLTPSERPIFRGRVNASSKAPNDARVGGVAARGGRNHTSRDVKPRAKNAFCKSSEIPKGDPKRWETDWTGGNHGQNNGKAQHPTKRTKSDSTTNAPRRNNSWNSSDQNKPPSLDSAGWPVQKWDNNLPPAPLEWEFRSQFRPGQNQEQIQAWLDRMEGIAMDGVDRQPNLDDLSVVDGFTYTFASPQDPVAGKEYVAMGEIVPRYWIRDHYYGRVPLATFFDENLKSIYPRPVDDEDLVGAKPWWETVVRGGSFLKPCDTHDHRGVDPDEGCNEKLRRQCDFGSQHAADNKKRYELAKRGITEAKQRREAEKEAKRAALKQANGGFTPDNLKPIGHVPKDLFVRYALSDDMTTIRDMYNYYVDFSTSVSETKRLTVMELREQFDDITQHSKLPYLIAYQKGKLIHSRKKGQRHTEPIQLADQVVGFVRADEYGSGTDAYRFTATLEVFVHKDHLMNGIAKCLMDKALALLDPDHIEQGGYKTYGDELCAAKPIRNIKNIMVTYLYPADQPHRVDRMSRWLVNDLRFKEVGNLNGIGTKLTKAINKTIFVRETGAVLDHANPPDTERTQKAKK